MRTFEKISFEQFKHDVSDDKDLYNSYTLPKRSTKYSAGYDFESLTDVILHPGDRMKIPTGVKVKMKTDECLFILIRSSLGFKYNIRLTNQVGLIESDYYNNTSNEGHIWVSIQNEGDEDFVIHKEDHLVQGVFTKFLTIDEEESIETIRRGGIGSTNKEEI